MKLLVSVAIVAAIAASANQVRAAEPAAPQQLIPITTISKNKLTQTVDCRGGDLLVSGSRDTLRVTGCPFITISGNGNRIHAQFVGPSGVTASGDNNNVRWAPGPDHFSTRVSSTGSGNELNPVMSAKDLEPFPIEAAGLKSH